VVVVYVVRDDESGDESSLSVRLGSVMTGLYPMGKYKCVTHIYMLLLY